MTTYRDYTTILPEAIAQGGVITRAQMRRLGITDDSIHRMTQVEDGLAPVIRGVYIIPPVFVDNLWDFYTVYYHALEPALFSREKIYPEQAAQYGVMSHYAAAAIHECAVLTDECYFTARKPHNIPRTVTIVAPLDPSEITVIEGLPVTTLERTTQDFGRLTMDGEHRARWMDFLYLEHEWPREKILNLIGEKASTSPSTTASSCPMSKPVIFFRQTAHEHVVYQVSARPVSRIDKEEST